MVTREGLIDVSQHLSTFGPRGGLVPSASAAFGSDQRTIRRGSLEDCSNYFGGSGASDRVSARQPQPTRKPTPPKGVTIPSHF